MKDNDQENQTQPSKQMSAKELEVLTKIRELLAKIKSSTDPNEVVILQIEAAGLASQLRDGSSIAATIDSVANNKMSNLESNTSLKTTVSEPKPELKLEHKPEAISTSPPIENQDKPTIITKEEIQQKLSGKTIEQRLEIFRKEPEFLIKVAKQDAQDKNKNPEDGPYAAQLKENQLKAENERKIAEAREKIEVSRQNALALAPNEEQRKKMNDNFDLAEIKRMEGDRKRELENAKTDDQRKGINDKFDLMQKNLQESNKARDKIENERFSELGKATTDDQRKGINDKADLVQKKRIEEERQSELKGAISKDQQKEINARYDIAEKITIEGVRRRELKGTPKDQQQGINNKYDLMQKDRIEGYRQRDLKGVTSKEQQKEINDRYDVAEKTRIEEARQRELKGAPKDQQQGINDKFNLLESQRQKEQNEKNTLRQTSPDSNKSAIQLLEKLGDKLNEIQAKVAKAAKHQQPAKKLSEVKEKITETAKKARKKLKTPQEMAAAIRKTFESQIQNGGTKNPLAGMDMSSNLKVSTKTAQKGSGRGA